MNSFEYRNPFWDIINICLSYLYGIQFLCLCLYDKNKTFEKKFCNDKGRLIDIIQVTYIGT